MRRIGGLGVVAGLVLAAVLASGGGGRLSASEEAAQGVAVVINELQYDPPPSGSESGYEWFELHNPGPSTVDLAGWRIADNLSADTLPDLVLPPGGFAVVAGGEGFAELFPGFGGVLVTLGGSIGNGLGNTGDQLQLLDAAGAVVDAMSYGDNAAFLDPPAPDVAAGHSLERVPAGADTDSAADWQDQPAPSPGEAGGLVRPTDPPTAAPPATLAPGVRVLVNEYLPSPRAVDWDGDGQATRDDEWVELFNAGDALVALRGWQLDDIAEGGSTPFVFPDGAVIAPRGHLVVFKKESGLSLNNDSDSVRLLHPDGSPADAHSFDRSQPDQSIARQADGDPAWTDSLAPSPGGPNGVPATPTPPGGPAPATPTPPGSGSPAPTPFGATGTATGPAPRDEAVFLPLLISEVLYDPELPGADALAEWVELHNRGSEPLSLAGWAIGDRAAWDRLPEAVLPPGGFLVIAAAPAMAERLAGAGASAVALADGAIGNGLANRGDLVRLRGPTGQIADALSYGDKLDAFDPAVPLGPPGASIERIPPGQDSDTAEDWWLQPAPSPGRAGARHEGAPKLLLNEVLPAPGRRDWDGDGQAGHTDEWVELFNGSAYPVSMEGWRIADREAGGWTYDLPALALAPGGYYLAYRAQSGLALDNAADTLRLIRPDGMPADRFQWTASPGYDQSWSRSVDGDGDWTADYAVTPGSANRPRPAEPEPAPRQPWADARAAGLAELRALPAGTRVRARGRVTAPPGPFGAKTAYIGDETAGVMLYLASRGALPALAEGEQVTAVGRLRDYRGEREIVLERLGDLWREGPGRPPPPLVIATGALGEALEGRLVQLAGRVVARSAARLDLDDGSGSARVTIRPGTGMGRLSASPGDRVTVVGIVGQQNSRAQPEGGHRLMPRGPADLLGPASARLPRALPHTGGGGGAGGRCPDGGG